MELLIINLRNGHRFRRDDLPNLFTAQRGDVRYRVRFLPARVRLHPDQHRVRKQHQKEHVRHLQRFQKGGRIIKFKLITDSWKGERAKLTESAQNLVMGAV